MTTSLASDEPVAASAAGDGPDPFLASPSGPTHLRHSNFDTNLFALAPGSSAEQVKRAIQAHLRDTERRMEEAGKLGTALVQQQKELTEKLREVDQLQSEAELTPELRHRLVEIEKDYNEVARDSARALLPKQRVPSNEAQSSPFSPDKSAARRSVSPSKFETLAAPSPTKFSVPNRKIRNQPANRIHDIEFAAEISTSLIAQVRNLQALLSEREVELKEVKSERSRLEIEAEGFQQRLKSLDESESRYKDENWNLETQIHELMAAQKEAAEREKRLAQQVNAMQSEKNATQRELEEAKESYAKLDEKRSAEVKNLEIELGISRRNAAVAETERSALQRKAEELTSQNTELAKAYAASQRGRALEREGTQGGSEEDSNSAPDHNTPEHSPPPSPMKPTPRHPALESETLKTSLGHAQRTIQTLRTNMHREKTEKLELKRMLQDARDEIEKLRSDPNPAPKKSRKAESRDAKKPSFKLNQLGVPRASRTEVVEEDEWEDQSEMPSSPRLPSHRGSTLRLPSSNAGPVESSSDHFETANETSDAAFETANEPGTETEDFQTGVEDMSDDDAATETEAGPSRGPHSIKRPPPLPPHHSSNHYSFDSTASTSSDDDDYPVFSSELRTPTSGPRMRMRASRGSLGRRSRQFSEEPALNSSPASIQANNPSMTPGGQSLFAELNDVDNSDDSSCAGAATPSRRSIRSVTPATPRSVVRGRLSPPPEVPALPKMMVDSGMMTEPMEVASAALGGLEPGLGQDDHPVLTRQGVSFPERPMSVESVIRPHHLNALTEKPSPPPSLSVSYIQTQSIEPQSEPESTTIPLSLSVSSILSEQTEPVTEVVQPPALSISFLPSLQVEPVAEAAPEPPKFSMPAISAQDIEPLFGPEPPVPRPPTLSIPPVVAQDIWPIPHPPATFSLAPILSEHIGPTGIYAPGDEERYEPTVSAPVPAVLSVSPIVSEHVVPRGEERPSPVELSISPIASEEVMPLQGSEPPRPSLAFAPIQTVDMAPREATAPPLVRATVRFVGIEPQDAPESPAPPLSLSRLETQSIEPTRYESRGLPPTLNVSRASTVYNEPGEPQTKQQESPASSSQPQAPGPQTSVLVTSHQGAQTDLTSEAIDRMVQEGQLRDNAAFLNRSQSMASIGTPSTVRIHRPQEGSVDGPPRPPKIAMTEVTAEAPEVASQRRPGSSASGMTSTYEPPPLPANHKEAIEAARSGSSQGGQGTIGLMGPPSLSASAMRAQNQSLRPRTPNTSSRRPTSPVSVASGRGTPTPRAAGRSGANHGTADVHEVQSLSRATMRSRKSSLSSFTSEIDTRFNMNHAGGGFDPQGFGPNTDPRMIQSITQTMIGEYLFKYTRTALGTMSERRHRRYFWLHPYTRTLYWSSQDPSEGGISVLKAKSVQIEAVRVVKDDNPMPPGLHSKSLVVLSPGRNIKFTCKTGQRHETWHNALSYLLLRTAGEEQADAEEIAGNITRDDVDEFNPPAGRRPTNGSRASPSLSSVSERPTRRSPTVGTSTSRPANERPTEYSPTVGTSTFRPVPTLTPSRTRASQERASHGTLSRIGGYFDTKLGSMRSRSAQGRHSSLGIYESDDLHDSAEDVREMIERQDREADRLENVRACCDGKHDVGTLTGSAKKSGRHSATGFRSSTPTPMGTVRSRK